MPAIVQTQQQPVPGLASNRSGSGRYPVVQDHPPRRHGLAELAAAVDTSLGHSVWPTRLILAWIRTWDLIRDAT